MCNIHIYRGQYLLYFELHINLLLKAQWFGWLSSCENTRMFYQLQKGNANKFPNCIYDLNFVFRQIDVI